MRHTLGIKTDPSAASGLNLAAVNSVVLGDEALRKIPGAQHNVPALDAWYLRRLASRPSAPVQLVASPKASSDGTSESSPRNSRTGKIRISF